MILMDDFEQLKREVEEVTQQRDKATGAYEQIMKRIRTEFGCKTLEEAEALLTKLEKRERAAAIANTEAKQEFEKKWKKSLEEL